MGCQYSFSFVAVDGGVGGGGVEAILFIGTHFGES